MVVTLSKQHFFYFIELHPDCIPHDEPRDFHGNETSNEDLYDVMKRVGNDIATLIWNV